MAEDRGSVKEPVPVEHVAPSVPKADHQTVQL